MGQSKMKKTIQWERATYKDWIGVSAAPVFWLASLICFVMGLAFKTGTGILLPGTDIDIIIFFSLGLGFANTAIQIVGNDTEREDLGMPLLLMWGASYILGIGSNVNFLYSIIGLTSPFLQFMVCSGLGVMIEVAPERLLVRFLRAVGILANPSKFPQPSQNPRRESPEERNQRQQELRRQSQSVQEHNKHKWEDKDDGGQEFPPFLQNRNKQAPEPSSYHPQSYEA